MFTNVFIGSSNFSNVAKFWNQFSTKLVQKQGAKINNSDSHMQSLHLRPHPRGMAWRRD